MSVTSATLVPFSVGQQAAPPFIVRLGHASPDHAVYVRRRLATALVILGLLAVIGASARSVLADRGGVPASIPAIRPVTAPTAGPETVIRAAIPALVIQPSIPPPVAAGAVSYIVQPGDTLWSLARLFHGSSSVSSYVDALVDAAGGASLQVGELLTLP